MESSVRPISLKVNRTHHNCAAPHPTKRHRVYQIEHWEALAEECGFSGTALARECGISLRHLQRHFQSAYGLQLQTWLNCVRLSIAFTRLLESESVKYVAFDLGFKQPSHFSREFKRFFGLSPTQASHRYRGTVSLLFVRSTQLLAAWATFLSLA